MKKICILGSTGSIGTQTLEIVREYNSDLEVVALSAAKNVELIEKQIREFKPKFVCMYEENAAKELAVKIADTDTKVLAGKDVLSVGKIVDIFVERGITEYVRTEGNADGIEKTLKYMDKDFDGLCFVNLVDYDMLYGHRRDIDGYAKALTYFDKKIPEMISKLKDDDILMVTADHGCDPAFLKTTDHTREYIPLLMYGKNIKAGTNYGIRDTFADIAETVLSYLGVEAIGTGKAIF